MAGSSGEKLHFEEHLKTANVVETMDRIQLVSYTYIDAKKKRATDLICPAYRAR